MLQGEHSAILSTCTKLTSVFKTFVLSIFEWPLKTVFTVLFISTTFKLTLAFIIGLMRRNFKLWDRNHSATGLDCHDMLHCAMMVILTIRSEQIGSTVAQW